MSIVQSMKKLEREANRTPLSQDEAALIISLWWKKMMTKRTYEMTVKHSNRFNNYND